MQDQYVPESGMKTVPVSQDSLLVLVCVFIVSCDPLKPACIHQSGHSFCADRLTYGQDTDTFSSSPMSAHFLHLFLLLLLFFS